MVDVIAFVTACVEVFTSFTYGGVPVIYILLGCLAVRLVLAGVIRTADGGVSDGE